MKFTQTRHSDDLTCVAVEGDVVQQSFNLANDPVMELIGPEIFRRNLVLDLSRVPFMGSIGINYLVSCHKRCRAAGGRLIVHSITPMVQQPLKLMGMYSYLTIAADESAAKLCLAAPETPA